MIHCLLEKEKIVVMVCREGGSGAGARIRDGIFSSSASKPRANSACCSSSACKLAKDFKVEVY